MGSFYIYRKVQSSNFILCVYVIKDRRSVCKKKTKQILQTFIFEACRSIRIAHIPKNKFYINSEAQNTILSPFQHNFWMTEMHIAALCCKLRHVWLDLSGRTRSFKWLLCNRDLKWIRLISFHMAIFIKEASDIRGWGWWSNWKLETAFYLNRIFVL